MNNKHYYKLSYDTFVKLYKLTKDDLLEIQDTINISNGRINKNEATSLLLVKIYEDSRKYDPEYVKNVNRMLNQIDKSHKELSQKF